MGEAIPLGARILTVVDCFDALTSDRPYRRRMTNEDALAIVKARSGTMYDPRVVDAFITLLPDLRAADMMAEGPPASSDGKMLLTRRLCASEARSRSRRRVHSW